MQALSQPGHREIRALPGVDTEHAGAWVFTQKTVDASGHSIGQFGVGTACASAKPRTSPGLDHCVRAHGFLSTDVLQPASRFWLFQGIEAGLFVGLALALLALSVWWLRRRVA